MAAWKRPSPAVPSARSAAKTLRAARRASASSALRSVSRRPVAAWVQGELLRGALTRACRLQGGRIVIAWLHPKCFLMNTQVSIADSNRGKCKFSKKKIEKGDLRFGWRIGEETWVNCLVDHVHDTVVPAALGASSHDSESAILSDGCSLTLLAHCPPTRHQFLWMGIWKRLRSAARDDFKATDITGMSGLTPADRAR